MDDLVERALDRFRRERQERECRDPVVGVKADRGPAVLCPMSALQVVDAGSGEVAVTSPEFIATDELVDVQEVR